MLKGFQSVFVDFQGGSCIFLWLSTRVRMIQRIVHGFPGCCMFFFKVVQDCMVFKGLKGFHEISLGVHSF